MRLEYTILERGALIVAYDSISSRYLGEALIYADFGCSTDEAKLEYLKDMLHSVGDFLSLVNKARNLAETKRGVIQIRYNFTKW